MSQILVPYSVRGGRKRKQWRSGWETSVTWPRGVAWSAGCVTKRRVMERRSHDQMVCGMENQSLDQEAWHGAPVTWVACGMERRSRDQTACGMKRWPDGSEVAEENGWDCFWGSLPKFTSKICLQGLLPRFTSRDWNSIEWWSYLKLSQRGNPKMTSRNSPGGGGCNCPGQINIMWFSLKMFHPVVIYYCLERARRQREGWRLGMQVIWSFGVWRKIVTCLCICYKVVVWWS